MNIRETAQFLKNQGLHPNKKLGQNFLCNDEVIKKIADALEIQIDEQVLEIGPGTGRLTEKLAALTDGLTIVEIDNGLYTLLTKQFGDTVRIVHADFLKWPIDGSYSKVIGNLPYYCSSEILFRIAAEISPVKIVAMLQKEMAERLISRPGDEGYGAITVTLNYYYRITKLFNVDRFSFYPVPDVTSTVISLDKNTAYNLDDRQLKLFHLIVKAAFWGRRKTLLKTLHESPHMKLDKAVVRTVMQELGLDDKIRGENLSTDDFVRLSIGLNTTIGGIHELY